MFPQILFSVFCLSVSASSYEDADLGWQDLGCEEGHKYLFKRSGWHWEQARVQCELLGGWLLSINSQQEQNCLLRFAHSSLSITWQHFWYWHDGGISTPITKGGFRKKSMTA